MIWLILAANNGASELHSAKALQPMEVTESGMCTAASEMHPPKACSPMEVTETRMCNAASELHPLKAKMTGQRCPD